MITAELKGKVIVGGSFISLEAYRKAISAGVAGVVVGGFNYADLEDILGFTLGVAITGSEDLDTSLIVTEGYGKIRMGERTFALLKEHEAILYRSNGRDKYAPASSARKLLCLSAREQVTGKYQELHSAEGVQIGSLVRIIRAPYFGHLGKITELPPELQKMESETLVRVAMVDIDGEIHKIPRSNLEMVETD